MVGFGYDGDTALSSPSEEDLCRSLLLPRGDLRDRIMLKQSTGILIHTQFDETGRPETAVRGDGDSERFAKFDERFLS